MFVLKYIFAMQYQRIESLTLTVAQPFEHARFPSRSVCTESLRTRNMVEFIPLSVLLDFIALSNEVK